MKTIKKNWEIKQKLIRNLSEEDKNKKREYGKTDIIICLKNKNRDQKNIKIIIARLKSLNMIMNEIVF